MNTLLLTILSLLAMFWSETSLAQGRNATNDEIRSMCQQLRANPNRTTFSVGRGRVTVQNPSVLLRHCSAGSPLAVGGRDPVDRPESVFNPTPQASTQSSGEVTTATPLGTAAEPTGATGTRAAETMTEALGRQSGVVANAPVASGSNPCGSPALTAGLRGGIPGIGQIPSFLQTLHPIHFDMTGARQCRGGSRITICVLRDYLATGTDSNYVHYRGSYDATVARLAQVGFTLPTTRMVDAIRAQAQVRLPFRARGVPRTSQATYNSHSAENRRNLAQLGHGPDTLVAGHMKDTVLDNRVPAGPGGRVPIYGAWSSTSLGTNPIQSLSTVHGDTYTDYSQGFRGVSQWAFVNGTRQALPLASLLGDPACASVLARGGQALTANTLQQVPHPNSSAAPTGSSPSISQ